MLKKQDKWVRRFEVNESAKHKRGFTIYKITSVLFPISSPEVLSIVSVWKRYSEVQTLHHSMKRLHAGLRLKGVCPDLPTTSYFKRFQPEVIRERGAAIKALLEFVAEHQLLFASTEFVNFLQTGHPAPESSTPLTSSIANIRSSLHLPIEDCAPLEYGTDDDCSQEANPASNSIDETDYAQIPIYEAADIELPKPDHKLDHRLPKGDSFESLNSLESIDSDLYSELEKVTVSPKKSCVKKSMLPDLINFDEPSTSNSSKFDDYHTMTQSFNLEDQSQGQSLLKQSYSDSISLEGHNSQNQGHSAKESSKFDDYHTMSQSFDLEGQNQGQSLLKQSHSDSISLSSNTNTMEMDTSRRSSSRTSHSMLSLSNLECKTRTEDSYIFESGYLLNMARRCEHSQQYDKAFHWYKVAIEKMLIGVQDDADPQRRALVKRKTDKYLSYAEQVYRLHLTGDTLQPERDIQPPQMQTPPISMLRRPYEDLSLYRVLAVLGDSMMLVLHRGDQSCYAMKVIQKIPNNLTEFDEYFMKNSDETRKPILPTLVPYMVSLISYIETNNLIFLILNYAPGQKLLDYIKNYVKSVPNTPARELNLENVFAEPKVMKFGKEEKAINTKDVYFETDKENLEILEVHDKDFRDSNRNNEENYEINENTVINEDKYEINKNIIQDYKEINADENIINQSNNNKKHDKENTEKSIDLDKKCLNSDNTDEIVRNSKTLLQNVDRILKSKEVAKIQSEEEIDQYDHNEKEREDNTVFSKEIKNTNLIVERRTESPLLNFEQFPSGCIPPSTIQQWGAEILTAIDSLHRCGVVIRDLSPSNILLGDRGQVCLTYIVGYSDYSVHLPKLKLHATNMYIAPELYDVNYCMRLNGDGEFELERVCDFWSFGAIMYEIICGMPLSHHHPSVFSSHTILTLPPNITIDETSLLTQLLTHDPCARLGSGTLGIQEIKDHPYFRHIHWQSVVDHWGAGALTD